MHKGTTALETNARGQTTRTGLSSLQGRLEKKEKKEEEEGGRQREVKESKHKKEVSERKYMRATVAAACGLKERAAVKIILSQDYESRVSEGQSTASFSLWGVCCRDSDPVMTLAEYRVSSFCHWVAFASASAFLTLP